MLTAEEFGKRIKEKYPVYESMDNITLAKRVAEKYPVYESQVQFEKEPGIVDKVTKKVKSMLPEGSPDAVTGAAPVKRLESFGVTRSFEEQPKSFGVTRSFEESSKDVIVKPETAVPEQTAVMTDPLIEEKYKAVAESESALTAGIKEAGLAVTYSKSPVSKYRREEHPVASIVGKVAGTVAPMLVGGTGTVRALTSVPKVAQIANSGKAGAAAVNGVARMTTAAIDYIARHNDDLFSEDSKISNEAKKNLAINIAASAASPLPETFLPKNLIQPFAQGATDLLVETIGQAVAGDNAFNEKNLVNTVASTIAGTAFGIADIKGVNKNTVNSLKKISKANNFEMSKERSDKLNTLIKEDLERVRKPAQSNIIESEKPEFTTKMTSEEKAKTPEGIEIIRNVRQPPTEADLKQTVDLKEKIPYIKDKGTELNEQQSQPQQISNNIPSRPQESGTEALPPDASSRPADTPGSEEIRSTTPESWRYGDAEPKIEATLAETTPKSFNEVMTGKVSEEIDRLNTIAFKSEGMRSVDEQMNAKLTQNKEAEKLAGQRGSIRLFGESTKMEPTGGVREVSEALEAGRFSSLNPVEKIKQAVNNFTTALKRNFTKYEPDVEDFPQYRDDRRTEHAPMRRQIFDITAKYRHASLGKLFKKEGKKGLRKATDILILKNLKLRGGKGQTLENNLSVEQVTKHLDWLLKVSSPEVLEAAKDMKVLLKAAGQELVERGKLSAESLEEDYFPHQVLDYLPDFMRGLKTPMNRKFREPYRPYTKKAIGSKRIIASDDSVIWTHLAKVLADNAHEDWITKQATKYDAMNRISPQERKKLYKGYETVIDGKRYKTMEWKKTKYKAKAIDESKLASAIENDMLVKDWLETKGPRGGEPVREITVSGKPQHYLLPKAIAEDLDNLIEKSPPIYDLLYSIGHLTQKWKGLTLGTAALPYQMGNIMGDAISTSIFDPLAHTYLPKATSVALKIFYPDSFGKNIKLNTSEQKLFDVSQAKDVSRSGMTSELRYSLPGKALNIYKDVSEFRESLLRLSILAHQLDRIDNGKSVQNLAGIDLTGLDPESAAGKVAREVLVDYTAVPRSYQLFLSRGMLPFVRFAEGNARNYARAMSRNKGTHKVLATVAPVIGAYAAQWAYNNLNKEKKKLEMQLPDYIRNRWHLNLGETKEGNIRVWAAQQPVDMAMSWLGLDNMNRIASDLADKRVTVTEAAKEFLKAVGAGAPENISTLLNPAIQAWIGLKTNEDPFTHRKIMPDDVHKEGIFSKNGRKFSIGYLGEKLFAPAAQYTRTKRGTEPYKNPYTDWIFDGPLNAARAFGFYEIDPRTQKLSRHYKIAGPILSDDATYQVKFYDILDKYGKDVLTGLKAQKESIALTDTQSAAIKAIEKLTTIAEDNGFTGLEYGKWLKSTTARRKIIDAELRKTTNISERKKLREEKKEIITQSLSKGVKQLPKTGRKKYIDEMKSDKALIEQE